MGLTAKNLLDWGKSSNKEPPTRRFPLVPFLSFCLVGFIVFRELTQKQFKVFSSDYLGALSDEHLSYQREGHRASKLLGEAQTFLLNDKTMRLSPYVDRLWLDTDGKGERPTKKLILTDYAWNHPDQKYARRTFARTLRSRELLQAYIDHPHFDPAFSWSDMVQGKVAIDVSIQYVVLLDIETCHETNYPYYGGSFLNMDTLGGRLLDPKNGSTECFHVGSCQRVIQLVLDSPLFRQVNASTLLYLTCRGSDPDVPFRRKQQTSKQLSLVSIDGTEGRLFKDVDMGLPPPAGNPVTLSNPQRQAIHTCDSEDIEQRPYLLTFVGSGGRGPIRKNLTELHNGKDVLIMERDELERIFPNETFASLLQTSSFGATPRGDNLFSYRFTEVLSAGAIPVVHADEWVLPFHPKLVDWSKCAVVIPEKQYNQTLDILHGIARDQRCRMRQYCFEVYQKYMANPEANIAGLIASVEAIRGGNSFKSA